MTEESPPEGRPLFPDSELAAIRARIVEYIHRRLPDAPERLISSLLT